MEIDITKQWEKISKEVQKASKDVLDRADKEAAKFAAEELHNTSPRQYGDYASGWKVKRVDECHYIVYNAEKPSLTHLLEDGHTIKNYWGKYGRANGIKHIEPAAKKAGEKLLEVLKKEMQEQL